MKYIQYGLLSLFITVVMSLQAQELRFQLPTGLQTTVGETLEVPVSSSLDLDEFDIYAYTFTISYNQNFLKLVSAQFAEPFNGFTNFAYSPKPGTVIVTGASSEKARGGGLLFTLELEAIGNGNTALNFVATGCVLNEGSPGFSLQNGSASIAAKPKITVAPNTVLVLIGKTVNCTVSGQGTPPYQWGTTDPSIGSISENGVFTALNHGKTRVFAEDALGLRDSSDAYFEVTAMQLSIPTQIQEWQGWEVDIPILCSDFSSIDLYSGQFTLSYFADVLQFSEVIVDNTVLQGSAVVAHEVKPGVTKCSFATDKPLTFSSDTLLFLRYKVPLQATRTTNLTLTELVFNEDIKSLAVGGSFLPKILPPLTLTPTTANLLAGEQLQFVASNGYSPYTWEVSDERVASVNQEGLLTAKEGGTVQLTVIDAVGARKTVENISIFDARLHFLPDSLVNFKEIAYVACLVDSIPEARSGVYAIEGELSISSNQVSILDLELDNSFCKGWQKTIVFISNQKIKFYLAGATPFNKEGVVFWLKLDLGSNFKEYDFCNVRFANILVNEGEPKLSIINGGIEGKEFTDQDRTICLGDNTGPIVAQVPEGKTITKWEKRLRRPVAGKWTNIAFTEDTYFDTPNAIGEWEYRATIDGESLKIANILVGTIPNVVGTIEGDSIFCNVPQTLRYIAKKRLTASQYIWQYRGEGAILHPRDNVLYLEVTRDITPGYLVHYTANMCGQSEDSLVLHLHPIIQPAEFTFPENRTYYNRDTVFFTDQSVGALDWTWTLTPAEGVVFTHGTSPTSQHPKIQFTQAGSYSVRLVTTNSCRKDTATKSVLIEPFVPGALSVNNAHSCLGESVTVQLNGSTGIISQWEYQITGSTEWLVFSNSKESSLEFVAPTAAEYTLRVKLANDRGYSSTTVMAVHPHYQPEVILTICQGSDYIYPDGTLVINLQKDEQQVSRLYSVFGCDSIITTRLQVFKISNEVRVEEDRLVALQEGAQYQWYNCTTGLAIPGATEREYLTRIEGIYSVVVSLGECSRESDCTHYVYTRLHKPTTEVWYRVAPNPTQGRISISYAGGSIYQVLLTDTGGQILQVPISYFPQEVQMDLSALATGFYYATIIDEKGKTSFKLIKK